MDPVEAACRDHWGRLLALLVAQCRDLSMAEDALGDAVEAAVRTWPRDGVPREPAAWLLTAARRRVVDRQRHLATADRKHRLLAADLLTGDPAASVEDVVLDADLPDERLRLVLLCCHPALAPESQAALALRLVLGLPTAEIARLFLVQEATMAARITRAKRRIVTSRIPFSLPDRSRWESRVEAAVRVAHLAFTAGYAPGAGDELVRADLAGEGVRLARLLVELAPDEPAAQALLALTLLHHARRDARTDGRGHLVLLADQDRARWRHDEIAEGLAWLHRVVPTSPYAAELVLQARIAALHDTAPAAATDWPAVVACYGALEDLTGSPVVRLNRAVAVAEAHGPAAGLALLAGLDDQLPRSHRLPAVRAELLRRQGDEVGARAAYEEAVSRCGNAVERAHLTARLCDLRTRSW